MKEATLETSTLKQIDLGKKRTGRPTTQWVDTAMKQVWDRSKHTFLSPYNAQQFDPDNPPPPQTNQRGRSAENNNVSVSNS